MEYPVQANFAGRAHYWMSRTHLRNKLKLTRQLEPFVASKADVFTRAVKKDVLKIVLASRQAVSPLTRLNDCFFGTARVDPSHHLQAAGLLGGIGGAALSCIAFPLQVDPRIGCLPCWAGTQLSAAAGLVPKAMLTGLVAAIALPGAVVHGAFKATRYRCPAGENYMPTGCQNETTLVDRISLAEVDPKYFFRSIDHYGFDLRELAQWARQKGEWQNPFTQNRAFCLEDQVRLFQHPSGLGRDTHAWLLKNTLSAHHISQETREKIADVIAVLAPGFQNNSAAEARASVAARDFLVYIKSLSSRETAALNHAFRAASGEGFVDLFIAVMNNQLCVAAFSNAVRIGLDRIKNTSPR